MPSDPHTILPEPREPWGWQRPQRFMLAVLLSVGLYLVIYSWERHPASLPDASEITHTSIPELEILVDPNTASVASLARIPGIGPKLAQRIVDYREKRMPLVNGAVFTKLADLGIVQGISKKKLEQLRPWLKLAEDPAILPDGLKPARVINPEDVPDEEAD